MKKRKFAKWLSCLLAIGMVMTIGAISALSDGANIDNFRDSKGELHYLWEESTGDGWEYDEVKNRLILNNLSGLYFYFSTNESLESGERPTLEIVLNGDNRLEGLNVQGYNLVFSGTGTLSLTGKQTAIEEDDEYGKGVQEDATLSCDDGIVINSGTLNISLAECDSEAGLRYYGIESESLTINGGIVTVTAPDPKNRSYKASSVDPVINGGKFETNIEEPEFTLFSEDRFRAICAKGVLAKGTELLISKEERDGNFLILDKQIPAGSYEIYDIRFMKGDQIVQPNGMVALSTPVPDGFNADSCRVYRQESDGKWTLLDSTISVDDIFGKEIAFRTDHFSLYAIVDESAAQSFPEDQNNSNNTDTAPPSEPSRPANSSKNPPPPTGDNDNFVLWFVLMGVGAAGLGATSFLRKRRRSRG